MDEGFHVGDLEIRCIIEFAQADIKRVGKLPTRFEPDRVWVAAARRMRSRLMAHEANMIRKARAHRNREWKPPDVSSPNLQANPLLEYYHEDSPTEPWGCRLMCRHARRMLDIYVELDIA